MALRPENRSSGLLAQVRPAGAIGPREGPGEAANSSFAQKLGPRRGLTAVSALELPPGSAPAVDLRWRYLIVRIPRRIRSRL